MLQKKLDSTQQTHGQTYYLSEVCTYAATKRCLCQKAYHKGMQPLITDYQAMGKPALTVSKENDTNRILTTDGSSNDRQCMCELRPLMKRPVKLLRALHINHKMQYM